MYTYNITYFYMLYHINYIIIILDYIKTYINKKNFINIYC